jgi:hypothetical protein
MGERLPVSEVTEFRNCVTEIVKNLRKHFDGSWEFDLSLTDNHATINTTGPDGLWCWGVEIDRDPAPLWDGAPRRCSPAH